MTDCVSGFLAQGFDADSARIVCRAIDAGGYVPGGPFAGRVDPDSGLIVAPDDPSRACAWTNPAGCLAVVVAWPWSTVALVVGGVLAVAIAVGKRL